MSCSLCGEKADSLGIWHRKCGCFTHTDCFYKNDIDPNYKTCPQHLGQVSAPEVKEPMPTDGVDYVLFPGTPENGGGGGGGIVSNIASLVLRKGAASAKSHSGGGIALLRQRVPIKNIMSKHKLGLQHLLKEGVHIVDFLDNGYTWEDIKCYEDMCSKGRERSCKVLLALGVRATHLKEDPVALPAKQMREDMGLISGDFCQVLGLTFPDTGSLRCDGDDNWNAKHCVDFGLSGQDLCDFGLTYLQQYEDLMYGLSKGDAATAERDLGMTREIIAGLDDCNEEEPPFVTAEEEQEEEYLAPLYRNSPPERQGGEVVDNSNHWIPEERRPPERVERKSRRGKRRTRNTTTANKFDRHGLVLEVFGGRK
jgi:hypothetical protein